MQTRTIIDDDGREITLTNVIVKYANRGVYVISKWITEQGTLCSPSNEEPACIESRNEVVILKKWCDSKGDLHRIGDLPAYKSFGPGRLNFEEWYVHGIRKRVDGKPTRVYYNEHGQVTEEAWIDHLYYHRLNGPAVVRYRDGIMVEQIWWQHGKIHSETEPVVYQYINTDYLIQKFKGSIDDINYHREVAKRRGTVLAALRPLPLPIYKAIWDQYCYQ